MKDNPMMQQYVAVYASSMGVMLLFKLFRGIAFVKVRRRHAERKLWRYVGFGRCTLRLNPARRLDISCGLFCFSRRL